MSKYRIIDTDTHLIEPPDVWTSRLPKSWGEDVLHVRWDNDAQAELWFFGDQPIKTAWQWANWGWDGNDAEIQDSAPESGPAALGRPGPTRQSEAHPATYDPKVRVQVMDDHGVEIQVLYPNLAGFDWGPFVHHPNPEIAVAHLTAYNDFQLDWVRAFPGRFIPMLVVPYWDVAKTVSEIERMADEAFGGIVTTGAPEQHGQPPLSSRSWDPMWRACEEAGLSVSFHAASGDFRAEVGNKVGDELGEGARSARDATHLYLENGKYITDLLMSGILARFPSLNFVSVESGMGWVPFVLEALDKRFIKNDVSKSSPEFGDMLPSDYFRRQVSINFWFEELKPFHIETIGMDSLLFETDFPHPTGFHWPSVEDSIDAVFKGLSDNIRNTILWDNPARLYANALRKQNVPLAT
jgi:predicted TIM-barrel fold metal-dependent hydrolase